MLYCRSVGKTAAGGSDYALIMDNLCEKLDLDALVEEVKEGVTDAMRNEALRYETMANTTFLVAKFAVEVAQFPTAEKLLVACIRVDEAIRGRQSTKLARDQLLLATLYVRNRFVPSDGSKGFIKGRVSPFRNHIFLDQSALECRWISC